MCAGGPLEKPVTARRPAERRKIIFFFFLRNRRPGSGRDVRFVRGVQQNVGDGVLHGGHGAHGILLPEHTHQFARSVAQLLAHHHGAGERHRVLVGDGHPVRGRNPHAEREYKLRCICLLFKIQKKKKNYSLQRTILEWRLVFWIMMIIMAGSSIVYVLFGSGEVQPWDDLEQHYLREKEKERRGLPMDERISIKQAREIEEGK